MDIIERAIKYYQEQYDRDLTAACSTFEVDKLRAHFAKYKALNYYPACFELTADDSVLEITMRKIVFNSNYATPEKQAEAGTWLIENGYDLYLD